MKTKIFVNVGTTYPFDRLTRKMDFIAKNKKYEIFLQIGKSNYSPKNCKYKDFFDDVNFQKMLNWADIVVSHAGVGSILEVIGTKKKLILIPRMKKFEEAVDDHQIEICKAFEEKFGIPWEADAKNLTKHFSKNTSVKIKKTGKLASEIKKLLVKK